LVGRAGEPEAGDGRGDDVEGVRRVAAVGGGVGERAEDVEELDDRAGPAVGDDERQRLGLGGAYVHEVDVLAVDDGRELRKFVEPGLMGAPVVGSCPVLRERLEVTERDAAVPAGAGQLAGPASAGYAVA
jgi:hypothetical protein